MRKIFSAARKHSPELRHTGRFWERKRELPTDAAAAPAPSQPQRMSKRLARRQTHGVGSEPTVPKGSIRLARQLVRRDKCSNFASVIQARVVVPQKRLDVFMPAELLDTAHVPSRAIEGRRDANVPQPVRSG